MVIQLPRSHRLGGAACGSYGHCRAPILRGTCRGGPDSFSGTAGAPGLVGDFATPCLSFPRAMLLSIQVLPACSCAIVLTLARCWGSSALRGWGLRLLGAAWGNKGCCGRGGGWLGGCAASCSQLPLCKQQAFSLAVPGVPEMRRYVQSPFQQQTMSLDNVHLRKLFELCRFFGCFFLFLNARGSSRADNEAAQSQRQGSRHRGHSLRLRPAGDGAPRARGCAVCPPGIAHSLPPPKRFLPRAEARPSSLKASRDRWPLEHGLESSCQGLQPLSSLSSSSPPCTSGRGAWGMQTARTRWAMRQALN